ncbi:MAG: hypothetical protein MI861_11240, partial [Pirellulales bacterium]|nr:hypothetical protein [Pirellulales bacterium]
GNLLQLRMRNGPLPGAIPARNGVVQNRVQIRIINGRKDITIEKNGKKLKIAEDAQGIRVEKTDPNGGTTTKRYKDLEELKKQDPESYKMFHNQPGAGIQFKFGKAAHNAPLPNQAPPNPALPAERKSIQELREQRTKDLQERLQRHRERLESMRRRLPATPAQPPANQDRSGKPLEVKELETKTGETIDV